MGVVLEAYCETIQGGLRRSLLRGGEETPGLGGMAAIFVIAIGVDRVVVFLVAGSGPAVQKLRLWVEVLVRGGVELSRSKQLGNILTEVTS